MICKKNGNLRLNRPTLLVFGSLLLSLFFLFFGSLKSYALSSLDNEFSNYYHYNDDASSLSGVRYGTYQMDQVVNLTSGTVLDHYVTGRAWKWENYSYIDTLRFKLNNLTWTNNSATIHFEYNYVFSQNESYRDYINPSWRPTPNFVLGDLGQLSLRYSNKVTSYSKVQYATTDWTSTFSYQSGPEVVNVKYFNTTVTIYVDLVINNLTVGATEDLVFQIGLSSGYPVARSSCMNSPCSNFGYATFPEKFDNEISFYQGPNEALQQAQINATNITNQLLQRQWEQEQQDRLDLQNISNQSNTDGSDATSNAEGATAPLLSAITTIYGYLLYPTPTDCVIGPLNVYDMQLGNLDFCTGFNVPQPIIAIGGLLMIGLIITLAYTVVRTGLSLYNELLGGKK